MGTSHGGRTMIAATRHPRARAPRMTSGHDMLATSKSTALTSPLEPGRMTSRHFTNQSPVEAGLMVPQIRPARRGADGTIPSCHQLEGMPT